MRLGAPSARTMDRFSSGYRTTAVTFPPFFGARQERSRWPSGKTSHEELLPVGRFVT